MVAILSKIAAVGAALQSVGIDPYGAGHDVWRLKMLDPPGTEFIGQFVAEDVTENIGARISNDGSLNKDETSKKYLGGSGDTTTFKARIFATNTLKNVKTGIRQLKSFAKRDPALKRAPIFRFQAGTEIAMMCFVKSPGGIVYDRPRRDSGAIRGATFNMALEVIEELPTKQDGMTVASLIKTGLGIALAAAGISNSLGKINIPNASLHSKGKRMVIKQGQTFEEIARIEYEDALSGDVLRRVYYQQPLSQIKSALETGDIIDLVDAVDLAGVDVTPQSEFLKDALVNRQVISDQFALRGTNKTIFV